MGIRKSIQGHRVIAGIRFSIPQHASNEVNNMKHGNKEHYRTWCCTAARTEWAEQQVTYEKLLAEFGIRIV